MATSAPPKSTIAEAGGYEYEGLYQLSRLRIKKCETIGEEKIRSVAIDTPNAVSPDFRLLIQIKMRARMPKMIARPTGYNGMKRNLERMVIMSKEDKK